MKFTLSWLKEHLETDATGRKNIADGLLGRQWPSRLQAIVNMADAPCRRSPWPK